MDPSPTQPWFYSRDGVQNGPVSFTELSQLAASGKLNPRLDLVWTQGMGDWKPAGETEGLFDKRPPAEAIATSNPYTPPTHDSDAERMLVDGEWPGIGRAAYFFGAIFVSFAIGIILVILDTQGIAMDPNLRLFMEYVLPTAIALYFMIQRLPNLGMSRWWTLAHLVPLLNVWVGYRSFACPPGYAVHKKLDGIGVALAIIYWLFILIIVGTIIFFIAVFAGMVGDAEMQKLFRDAINEAGAGAAPASP